MGQEGTISWKSHVIMFCAQNFLRTALQPRFLSTNSPSSSFLRNSAATLPRDFRFIPSFLDEYEQRILLKHALRKLDETGKRSFQRKRRGKGHYDLTTGSIADMFLPDEYYEFEEVAKLWP